MRKIETKFLIILTSVLGFFTAEAQTNNDSEILNANTITTAVPFLRINPDGRTGAMGDAGIAASGDANAVFLNTARTAFIDKDYGVSLSFVPWLRGISTDVYMADMVGYYKIKDMQTLSASIRYFSLGQINFTDYNGTAIGNGQPKEFSLDVNYARKLTKYYSLAVGMRYIYSNLSTQGPNDFAPGSAFGADLSMFYTKPLKVKKLDGAKFNWGLAITNIGSKMTYTGNAQNKDYIPTNFGFGLGTELKINEYNGIHIYADVNKLLVPTPIPSDSLYVSGTTDIRPEYDKDADGVPDYKQKSSVGAMFTSWGDAPGGFSEELKEFNFSFGAEYVYNEMFMVRAGYFYEPRTKGDRRYLSAGAGIKYSVFQLNFAYNIPTSPQRKPLDNTLRFTLLFDFAKGGVKNNGELAPTEVN
ncbi:MAG: type IX secretion system outer membrane channel protein PorV [Chitinophagales bacterium]|nr:type IX secretion system outer membrane channel protein PorV [Chitinophagales bacterium]